jgi:ABC-type microcin C transport system duplicated ATPase subunit YejF
VTAPLLRIRDLAVSFATYGGVLQALDGVSFDVDKGRVVALVGESGCGKSATALSILRLLASPPARLDRGEIRFEGRDLLHLSEREMRGVRGARIGMIFQDPMTALNPVYTIGFQLIEAIRLHRKFTRAEARQQAVFCDDATAAAAKLRADGLFVVPQSGALRVALCSVAERDIQRLVEGIARHTR